jgi:acyl-coenzyme A thioesterase PaaI-like protein
MDTTMAWAVLSLTDPDYSCTTIDCTIQYPAPAKDGPYFCRAWTTHQTGQLAFVRADITDVQETVVALGQATFRIIKMKFI